MNEADLYLVVDLAVGSPLSTIRRSFQGSPRGGEAAIEPRAYDSRAARQPNGAHCVEPATKGDYKASGAMAKRISQKPRANDQNSTQE